MIHETAILGVGARVVLRSPRASDEAPFLAAMKASVKLLRPWVQPLLTSDGFASYLERNQRDDFDALFACVRDGGAIAGVFNLSQIVRLGFKNAYLGYFAMAACAGQGLMSEGLELVLRHAFATLRLHRLEANIQPKNARSIKLVERAGFRLEGFSPRYLKIGGRWRDHERWAILSDDARLGHKGGRFRGR